MSPLKGHWVLLSSEGTVTTSLAPTDPSCGQSVLQRTHGITHGHKAQAELHLSEDFRRKQLLRGQSPPDVTAALLHELSDVLDGLAVSGGQGRVVSLTIVINAKHFKIKKE